MISKVVRKNDQLYFQVDDKVIDSLAFKSFRPTYKNVGEFYKAGVRLFHVYCSGLPSGLKVPYSLYGETWFGDGKYDFTNLDKQIDFFKQNAPDGYVFINVHLDVRQWWLDENPGNPNSFTHLSQIASNEKWRKDTGEYLKALIKHTEEKYNDFVIGYFLLGGYTTEWFSQFDHEEANDFKTKAYREYLGDNLAKIPSQEILSRPKNEVLLKENLSEILPYRKFHNELVANTVLYYCKCAQEVLEHKKIVGVFFGYLLELLYERMWEAGHIELDLINHSKDIDLFATPSSYQFRQYDSTGAYMLLCDSLNLNDKACFVSFDHTTFLVPNLPNNPDRVCEDEGTATALKLLAEMRSRNKKDLLQDRHQTIQAMRREFMQRISKRAGYWWFDMFEGWFYDEALMDEVEKECKISHEIMSKKKKSVSEVAVVFSAKSLYYMNKASEINTETVCNQREGLNRMGCPYDAYSLGDLNKIDFSGYKLVIFVECLLLDDEQRRIIGALKETKKLLFIGPVDYAYQGIKSTKEMLEMDVEFLKNEEKTVTVGETKYGYTNPKLDCVFVKDANAKALGTYAVSGKTGLAYKGNVFFSGIGNLDYKVLQEVLEISSVHIYSTCGEAVFVCENFVGIYAPQKESVELLFKEQGTYKEIFTEKIIQVGSEPVCVDTTENCAVMFMKV